MPVTEILAAQQYLQLEEMLQRWMQLWLLKVLTNQPIILSVDAVIQTFKILLKIYQWYIIIPQFWLFQDEIYSHDQVVYVYYFILLL